MFENYATGVRLSAEPLTSELLHFFDRWRSVESLTRRFDDFTPASLRTAVTTLEGHSLLERSNGPTDRRAAAFREWRRWNPAAGFFHFSTKDVVFNPDSDAVYRILRRKARRSPPPAPVKHYNNAKQYALPAVAAAGEFPETLLARRTWRKFSSSPVTLADLSTLLGLTWRVQGWLEVPGIGRAALKTSPSGGARHPIEVYVLALRIDGLPRGLYHYAADRHRLELLEKGASTRQILRYLPTQWGFKGAAALMLMTAVFPRTQWKYGFARAYRVVLTEAGHLCQTFCLTATWLGLAPFCTMALADSRIEQDLGIDGVTESVLYAAGVGTRPTPSRRTR